MTKAQLNKALDQFSDDHQIMILDGFNGGGVPREINIGPHLREISSKDAK